MIENKHKHIIINNLNITYYNFLLITQLIHNIYHNLHKALNAYLYKLNSTILYHS